MSADVIVRLAGIEAQNLIVLIDELVEVVDAEGADADPGVARLTPDAYPDDAQASAEFEQATRATLISFITETAPLSLVESRNSSTAVFFSRMPPFSFVSASLRSFLKVMLGAEYFFFTSGKLEANSEMYCSFTLSICLL